MGDRYSSKVQHLGGLSAQVGSVFISISNLKFSRGLLGQSFLWIFGYRPSMCKYGFINIQVLAERYTWLIHIMSWGVPLVVFAVSYSQNRFGFYHCEGYISMCWVQPHRGDYWWHIILWQLFAGKAWEITSYILVLTLYLSVKYNLKRFVCTLHL